MTKDSIDVVYAHELNILKTMRDRQENIMNQMHPSTTPKFQQQKIVVGQAINKVEQIIELIQKGQQLNQYTVRH